MNLGSGIVDEETDEGDKSDIKLLDEDGRNLDEGIECEKVGDDVEREGEFG